MSSLLFWLVIKPLSLLPYWVLYGISDFFYVILYYIVGYRKKVVRDNLTKSFPEKSTIEIVQIEKKFYHHFCDLVIESLKNFSITQEQANARMKHVNAEVFKHYAEQHKSVILVGGHYCNWELWAVTAAQAIPHRVVGIYKRLSNAYFDEKMRSSRGKFGLHMIPTKQTSDYFKDNLNELNAIVFAIDQSPNNPKKCMWINFLGRETAALFGAEKYAVEYDRPIIFGHMKKLKRGHYEVRYEVVCKEPALTKTGYITQMLHTELEPDIKSAPEFWLWSHKRWKHKRPAED